MFVSKVPRLFAQRSDPLIVMVSFKKYVEEMRTLEDQDVRRCIKENYSYMLRLNNLLSSLDEGYVPLNIVHSIVYNVCVQMYLQLFLVTCYLVRDDFVLASVQFHYLLLALFGAAFSFHFYRIRREVLTLHKMMSIDFHTYEDNELLSEQKADFRKTMFQQRLRLIPFLILIGLIALFIVVLGPFVDNLVGAAYEGDYFNGVYMNTPVPMYFPFEINSTVLHWTVVLFQIGTVTMLALSISGVIYIYLVTTQNMAYQLRVLILSLKTLYERAEIRYKRAFPGREVNRQTRLYDDDFQGYLTLCLKDNAAHHLKIREYYVVHCRVIQLPIFASFCMGTVVLALSMIVLVEKTNRIGLLITNTLAMAGELGNLFMACFFGEEILKLGEELNQAVYSAKWYFMNKENRKLISLFQNSTHHPFVIRASLIFTCSMNTFSSICNSAYSYFNMLSASEAVTKK